MPAPAIRPSSATPTKSVGTNARNPAAVAPLATRICPPACAAVAPRAGTSAASRCASRRRTQNWIAKSTAMPTNRIANATEIKFNGVTVTAANSVVSSRPSSSVSTIGTTSRQVRTASTSHSTTSTRLPNNPATAPWATVANSSSASATEPVSRTRAWPAITNSCRAASARSAAVAAAPGSNAPKSCRGCASTKRYGPPSSAAGPASRRCHDSGRGAPAAAAASASWKPRSGPANAARSCPCSTPRPSNESAANSPRADGSAAS